MTVVYPAVFTRTGDADDTYLVSIPDIGGMTEGHGFADALAMARDYIGNALRARRDAELPPASAVGRISPERSKFAGAGESFVSLVDVDLEAFRRGSRRRNVRRNITLPDWLDEMAGAAGINVSAVAQRALKAELGVGLRGRPPEGA